jgi:hypothetical protein
MTQKDKQLLIQVLCTLLPYGVQGMSLEGVVSPLLTRGEADWDILTSLNYRIVKHGWKPFLRPMSSMTEDEMEKCRIERGRDLAGECGCELDYLNSIHIDYRGLIEKGLALEAPEGMYNIKTE